MLNSNNGRTYQIIISILVAFLMFSIGFGASQLTVSRQVTVNETKIDNIERDVDRLVDLMEKLIEKLPNPEK